MAKENIERLTYLTEKIVNEEPLSVEEAAELKTFLASNPRFRSEYQRRIDRSQLDSNMAVFIRAKTNWRGRFDGVLSRGKISRLRQRSIPLWQYYSASAAILIFLVAGLVIMVGRHKKVREAPVVSIVQDIKPGGNRAILTLSDGSTLVLDSVRNGTIAEQGNSKVQKLSNGQLVYNTLQGKKADVMYNVVATPSGGQYQVTLQDGTRIWLNNASSLRYPAAFNGSERVVELTGEAYFEVAKNTSKPFKVSLIGKTTVEVLGTTFNINAYPDEPGIKTTLLEGSVRVSVPATSNVIIKPGEQAMIVSVNVNNGSSTNNNGNSVGKNKTITITRNADVDQAVAWKNGFFQFNGADIQAVMRSLARWYIVKVRYEGEIPKIRSTGSISRDNTASDVLKVLQAGGFHFRIEDDTIVIMP